MKTTSRSPILKWVPLALAATMSLAACTDREVAVGFGAAAIGAGAVAIGAAVGSEHHHGGHYVCEGGYRTTCHGWRDYWGRYHEECNRVYDSCFTQRWQPMTASNSALAQADVSEVDWSETFAMSRDSAQKLLVALESARSEEKLDAVLALGLSREDISAMGRFSMPSDEGIRALAERLDQDKDATRAMIEKLVTTAGERIRHSEQN